jgi:hypothetical protein
MTKSEYLEKQDSYGDSCYLCYGKNEPYMLTHDLWRKIGAGRNFMCITCVENTLGRNLIESDFLSAPINFGIFGFDCQVYCSLENK